MLTLAGIAMVMAGVLMVVDGLRPKPPHKPPTPDTRAWRGDIMPSPLAQDYAISWRSASDDR
ncbi:hypothetical protein [Bordetella genomosp. 13]|uniref:hypothetical protein n=1 Tax=Bordetella genomosp. 13 TaxID=463040 RepID=UPI0012F92F3D|nr:hypothetical protein [Bordetella genomosp. 13]